MTAKDFRLIASIIRTLPPGCRVIAEEAFVTRLREENPKFDAGRFRTACEE